MTTPAAKQALVPFAARFHIGYSDERLRTHPGSVATPSRQSATGTAALESAAGVIVRHFCYAFML
jgi:hypothetical protein